MVVIEIPKSTMDFEIGDTTYRLDMSDKTLTQLNNKITEIQMDEVKAAQIVQEKIAQYSDKLRELRNKNVIQGLNESEFTHEEHKLQNRFDRMVTHASNKSFEELTNKYIDFLNYVFGKDSGQKIYEQCSQSTVVLGKVITQISVNINSNQDLVDYRRKYKDKIRKLKDGDNTVKPDSVQE